MAISDKYLFMLPCNDNAGTQADDASGQGNNGLFGVGAATPWATSGRFTSTGGVANGGMYVDAILALDQWVGDSFIYMGWINRQNSGSTDIEHGNNRRAAGSGWQCASVGSERFNVAQRNGSGNTQNALSRYNIADGEDHHFALVVDGMTRTMSLFIDGKMGDACSGTFINGAGVGVHFSEALVGSMQTTYKWGWGSVENSATTSWNYAGEFWGIHLLKYPAQNLPPNIHEIIQASIASPYTALDASVAG